MNNIAKKPKKDKYLKLIFTIFKPSTKYYSDYSQSEYDKAIKRKLIIRKVLLEDNNSYYYKFKNKIQRVAKNAVEVISLYS